jgi:formylmethanofuran dehydrogenase subunit D
MSKVFSSKKSSIMTQSQFYEFSYKAACRVATTVDGTLSSAFVSGQNIDDVPLATGDRVLIKNQGTGAENGIYTVNASGVPTRAEDFNASSEVTGGAFVNISEGTANRNKSFVLTTNDTITLGTTALLFSEIHAIPEDDSVTTAKIADEAVTLPKMAHAAANTVLVRDANSVGDPSFKAVTDTQILIGDGTGFTAAALSGDVTMSNAGAVTIGTGVVETSMIADEAVTLPKMAHAAANTVLVRDANSVGDPSFKAITNTQILIGDGTGFTAAALSGDVTMSNAGAVTIGTGVVETSMIADESVTLPKMAHAAANTVLVRDANSVGDPSFKAVTNTQILIGDGTGFTAAALSGDVTMSNAGVVTIGGGVVETSMIADANVTNAKIATTIDAIKIADGSVSNTEFQHISTLSSNAQTQINSKAPLASPTFTGTVSGVTKAHVGLGSADNTADTAKPVSTAQQTALNLKANLASPALTGAPSGVAVGSAVASASASGVKGTIRFDGDLLYICVDTNTWKRAAIGTWGGS